MVYILPNDSEDLANRERIEGLLRLYEGGDRSVGPELMKLIGKRVPKLREEFTRLTGGSLNAVCLSGEADLRPEPVKAFYAMAAFEAFINCEIDPSQKGDGISLEKLRKQLESEERPDE